MPEYVEDEAVDVTHRHAVAVLASYFDLGKEESSIKNQRGIISGLIKGYLAEHPGETLFDGERRIEGLLQSRSGAPELDAANATTEVLRWLADNHCLKLDYRRFKTLEGKAVEYHDIAKTLMPGTGSEALVVKERE